jgi:hypothetical protein
VLFRSIGLTGCVYLRLLDVLRQLKDFDQNFTISGRHEMVITFHRPVVLRKDARFLIGADPVSVQDGDSPVEHYEFTMVRQATTTLPPLANLPLDLAFHKGKLEKIIVPESFLTLFPRRMFEGTLRQAADAEIHQLRKTARGRIRLPPDVDAEAPSVDKVRLLLGEPDDVAAEGEQRALTYRYRAVNDTRAAPIEARLTFAADGSLQRARIRWDQSTVDAEFVREP